MLKEIFIALRGFREAYDYSKRTEFLKWLIITGAIYVILLFLFFLNFLPFYNSITRLFFESMGLKERLQKFEDTLLPFLFIMGKIFFDIFLLLMCFSLYKFIFLLISSPLFTFLSGQVLKAVKPSQTEQESSLIKRIVMGWAFIIRANLWMFVFVFFLIPLALIPIIGWFAPLIMLILDIYYMGFLMFSFAQTTAGFSPEKSRYFVSHHKGLAIGNGMFFYALHAIPLLGWIMAPGLALVGATLNIHHWPTTEKK